MAHEKAAEPDARDTGITRLVAAERQWRSALDEADAEAARLIEAARAAEREADAALEREIGALVAERSTAAKRELGDRCETLRREAEQRAARYDGVAPERARAIALAIVDRLWRSGQQPTPAGVAGAGA